MPVCEVARVGWDFSFPARDAGVLDENEMWLFTISIRTGDTTA